MTKKYRNTGSALFGVGIADKVSKQLGVPKLTGRKFLNAFFDEITEQIVEGAETITIKGVGKIKLGYRAPRTYIHPSTGEYLQCPHRHLLRFTFSKHYQRALDSLLKKVIAYDAQKQKGAKK